MLTFKEYAIQNNISYESVRKQVNKYKDDLGNNIVKQGRVKYLNETAIKFLDEKRNKQNSDEVVDEKQVDDITAILKKENEFLKEQLREKDNQLKEKDSQLKEKDIQIKKEQDIKLREQELRLISEKKFLMLEERIENQKKEFEPEVANTREVEEIKKWWQIWK